MAQRIKVQDGRVVYQHTDPIIDIDFYIDGNLHVRNNTDIAGGLTTVGNANFNSDLTVTGNASVGNDLTVTGSATIQTNLNVNDTLYVTNDAYVYDSLFVTNNGSFGGDVTVTNNLNVLDSVTVTNSVTATNFVGAVSGNASRPNGIQFHTLPGSIPKPGLKLTQHYSSRPYFASCRPKITKYLIGNHQVLRAIS